MDDAQGIVHHPSGNTGIERICQQHRHYDKRSRPYSRHSTNSQSADTTDSHKGFCCCRGDAKIQRRRISNDGISYEEYEISTVSCQSKAARQGYCRICCWKRRNYQRRTHHKVSRSCCARRRGYACGEIYAGVGTRQTKGQACKCKIQCADNFQTKIIEDGVSIVKNMGNMTIYMRVWQRCYTL